MPFIKPGGGMQWRAHVWPKFTGGLANFPKADNECQVLNNFEFGIDGAARCRLGLLGPINAPGTMGPDQINGLFYDGYSKIIVAKANTRSPATFYCLSASGTQFVVVAYCHIDTVFGAGSAVFFEQINTASNNSIYFISQGATGLWSWDFSNPSAAAVTSFPFPTNSVVWHNGYMFVLAGNNLYFSNQSDPTTWPTNNVIPLSVTHGRPWALKSLSDRLIIFCSNGIQYLVNDPSTNPYVGLMVPDIPFEEPLSMAGDAGSVVFHSYANIVQLDGSIRVLTDKVTGITGDIYSGGNFKSGMALSPEYLAVRAADSSGRTILYMYDRLHFGTWSAWVYGTSSAFGNTPPQQALVAYYSIAGFRGFIMPGTDGDLYLQPLSAFSGATANPLWTASGNLDVPSAAITGQLTTRYTGIAEDRLIQKQLRGFAIYGEGTNIAVTINFVGTTGAVTTYTVPMNSTTLPLEQSLPIQGSNVPASGTFQEAQMTITGRNLNIRDVIWYWRPLRYGLPML